MSIWIKSAMIDIVPFNIGGSGQWMVCNWENILALIFSILHLKNDAKWCLRIVLGIVWEGGLIAFQLLKIMMGYYLYCGLLLYIAVGEVTLPYTVFLWIWRFIWSLFFLHFHSAFLHSIFISLTAGVCKHGAFCLLAIALSFKCAIVFTMDSILPQKCSSNSSAGSKGLERSGVCARACLKGAAVCSLMTLFPVITRLFLILGNMDISQKQTKMVRYGQVFNFHWNVKALCDKIKSMAIGVCGALNMLSETERVE